MSIYVFKDLVILSYPLNQAKKLDIELNSSKNDVHHIHTKIDKQNLVFSNVFYFQAQNFKINFRFSKCFVFFLINDSNSRFFIHVEGAKHKRGIKG